MSIPEMKHINTVIFDLDGVLINSIPIMQIAFTYAYQLITGNDDPPFAEYAKHFGKSLSTILSILNLPQTMIKPYIKKSNELIDQIKPYHHVTSLLNHLKKRQFNIGIATGKDYQRTRKILSTINFDLLIDYVVTSDQVKQSKPHPEMLFKHLDFFKISKHQAIMVGDATADITAGKNANLITAGALWGTYNRLDLINSQPNILLNSPLELLSILR